LSRHLPIRAVTPCCRSPGTLLPYPWAPASHESCCSSDRHKSDRSRLGSRTRRVPCHTVERQHEAVRHRVGKPDPLNPSFGIGPAGELRPERHPQLVSGERQRYGANQRVMPIEEKHSPRADADPAAGARHGMIEPHVEIGGIGLRPDRGSERFRSRLRRADLRRHDRAADDPCSGARRRRIVPPDRPQRRSLRRRRAARDEERHDDSAAVAGRRKGMTCNARSARVFPPWPDTPPGRHLH